jgi:hypothetical protein
MDTSNRTQGLLFAAAGLCAVVLGVFLSGLTTATGAIDLVSVITAVAGGMLVATGLYQASITPGPTRRPDMAIADRSGDARAPVSREPASGAGELLAREQRSRSASRR